jgi:hypothetical protein
VFGAHQGNLLAQQPSYHHFGKSDGLPSDHVYDILIERDEFIWFSTDKWVSRFDGRPFQNFTLNDGMPNEDN